MKIKKMTARFGALNGRTLELGGGLNVIYAPNESGKSTWCAFLRTMLYGLDTAQRAKAGQKPDKVKYRPWTGESMSGSLEAETSFGPVDIRRWTERDHQPMQAFSATVAGTDTPVRGLAAENAGEILTGVTREVFERSAFIRQAGMELENDPELDRRISAIVSSGDEDVSYMEADKRLRDWLRHRRSGKRGAIPELQAAMAETHSRQQELRKISDAAAAAEEEISRLESRLAAAQQRMTEARTAQRKQALADLGTARRRLREEEERCREAEDSLRKAETAVEETCFAAKTPEEAEKLADADGQKAGELYAAAVNTPSAKRAFWLLVPAVLALVLAFFLPQRKLLLGLGAAVIVLSGAVYAHLNRRRLAAARMLEERKELLGRYGAQTPEQIGDALAEYRGLWDEKEKALSRLREAREAFEAARDAQKETEARTMNDLDFVNGDNEAVRAAREAEVLRASLAEARERRALAEGEARALGDSLVLESELAEEERRCAALLRQEEALSLAEETLTRADGELQQRLSPRIAQKAAEYFSILTDGRYDELTLSRDLRARARRAGDAVGWETDYLSAGARDQLYLALRLALCDLVLGGSEPCPIVLDDALVSFDGERMARALDLLRRIAGERQVLLFTCHRREWDYFADDPCVTKLIASAEGSGEVNHENV